LNESTNGPASTALLSRPRDGRPRSLDDRAHERRIAPASAVAHDVLRELLRRVRLDVEAAARAGRDILYERKQVREHGPVRAGGE
jgi:hypothetical protein